MHQLPRHSHPRQRARDDSFKLEDGVSCAACHGMYQEWVGKHAEFLGRKNWRALSRTVKEEQYGMTDLWDPEKRARLCASCHIGNGAEGKVVTHAMYAAGHPPLPSVELVTFSDAMPRHWKYLSEKSPEVQKMLGYDPAKSGLERTQLAVIAGVVSFRESMNLIASQAAENEKNWPELAQFDCYACHHDLKTKSWRQQRGYIGPPGRPEMRPWPLVLVRAGILQASKGDLGRLKELAVVFNVHMKQMAGVFHAQPFGDARQVAAAASKLVRWSDDLLTQLRSGHFDRNSAQRIISLLGKESTRLIDFDSARQVAWSFHSIQNELDAGFFKEEDNRQLFKELSDHLKLELPRGRVEIVKDYLHDALEKLGNYEPARFSATFGQLLQRAEMRKRSDEGRKSTAGCASQHHVTGRL